MTSAGPAWFERALAGAARAGAPVTAVATALWEGGVRLSFLAAGTPVGVDVHARREGPAYATTASFTLYLRTQGLPAVAEEAVRAAIAAIRAADPGGLVPAKGEERPEDTVAPELRVGGRPKSPPYVDAMVDWLAVAATLPARLREAAALARGARASGDAYPFPAALGVPAGDERLRAWVLARYPEGFGREAFGADWGEADAAALMDVLGPLRAIGAVEVGDDGVRFHVGAGADVAIHAVLLWSPAVTAAARAAWGPGDGTERARWEA